MNQSLSVVAARSAKRKQIFPDDELTMLLLYCRMNHSFLNTIIFRDVVDGLHRPEEHPTDSAYSLRLSTDPGVVWLKS